MTSKEQPCQKQLDFLESMKVFEEVHEDEFLGGTHVHVWSLSAHDENSDNVEFQVL